MRHGVASGNSAKTDMSTPQLVVRGGSLIAASKQMPQSRKYPYGPGWAPSKRRGR